MTEDAFVLLVLLGGFLAWGYVFWKALASSEATLTTMALIVIVLGIIAATGLSQIGVKTPGAWAWFGTGIVMIMVLSYRRVQD